MMTRTLWWLLTAGLALTLVRSASGQSSSLVQRSRTAASTQPVEAAITTPLTPGFSGLQRRPISPATRTLQRGSLIAVSPEPPRPSRSTT